MNTLKKICDSLILRDLLKSVLWAGSEFTLLTTVVSIFRILQQPSFSEETVLCMIWAINLALASVICPLGNSLRKAFLTCNHFATIITVIVAVLWQTSVSFGGTFNILPWDLLVIRNSVFIFLFLLIAWFIGIRLRNYLQVYYKPGGWIGLVLVILFILFVNWNALLYPVSGLVFILLLASLYVLSLVIYKWSRRF